MTLATTLTVPPRMWSRPDWGQCLYSGAAGVLLLHVERGLSGDESAARDVERWAAVVCRDELFAHPDACGLFRGVPAVTFALHGSSLPDHQRALQHLDAQLVTIVEKCLHSAYGRIRSGALPALGEFDLIRGLTGLAACALRRGLHAPLKDILAYLVELTRPVQTKGECLPGWWTWNGPDDRAPCPGEGHANLGMAHGIAGPLALLALSLRRGIAVPGQVDAIARIVEVFDRFLVCDDGGEGHPERAPYDRIIVTVGPWDLPPTWIAQLAIGGRMVVPLRWRGQARSVAFVREVDRLRSVSVELCGFIPMTGTDQDGERSGTIDADGHVTLVWDRDQAVDIDELRSSFGGGGTATWSAVWSTVTVASGEPFDGIWLRLTATEPGVCRLSAAAAAVDAGACKPAVPSRSPALVEGASLAYLTVKRLETRDGTRRFELGAIGHGPDGNTLATRLCEAIAVWGANRTAQPEIVTLPMGTSTAEPAGILKPHVQLLISYPET